MLTSLRNPPPRAQAYKQARTEARAARRLAQRTAHVAAWFDALPQKPSFVTPKTLESCLGQPMQCMAPALRWLGWHKIIRRVWGKQVWLWIPPDSTLVPRPRGRPRIYLRD